MDDTIFPASRRDPSGAARQGSGLPAVPVGDDLPGRCRTRCWVSVVLAAFVIAGALVGMAHAAAEDERATNEQDPTALVYIFALGLFVALHLAMYAYRQARSAAALRDASWQRSTHELSTTGRGKSSRDRLELDATGLAYRPSNYLGAPKWVRSTDEVEWAGDPHGYIVVRQPDGGRLALFLLEK